MRTQSSKEKALYLANKLIHRVIGQAKREGASKESILAYLAKDGINDPETMYQIVVAAQKLPALGGGEIMDFGGRDGFRALFGLEPTGEAPPSAVQEPNIKPKFRATEAGDAEYFVDLHADILRYDHRQGRWLIVDEETGIWMPDKTEHVVMLAIGAMRQRQQAAFEGDHESHDAKMSAVDWTMKGESRSRLMNMLTLASSIPPVSDDGEHWDEDPWLLGCLTGVIDLRTGAHRKAEPEEHITLQARVAYDPAATAPLWESTLAGIFGPNEHLTEEDGKACIGFLQRAMGYSITGDCREECCFFAWGDGANGKGTIMNTIGWLLQDYTDDMPMATLEKSIFKSQAIPNDVAKLVGKRMVTCAEVNEFSINESRLKALTGRDPMTARFLNKEFFTFYPVSKIWIATNNKPRITGTDDGIWRRIHLIPFTNTFDGPKKDLNLKDRLKEELPGILNWLVKGSMDWLAQGLNPPNVVKVATEEYRHESDPLTPFFDQRCVIVPGAKVQGQHIWNEYNSWCDEAEPEVRFSDKTFFKTLKKRFQTQAGRQTFYLGIGLREARSGSEPGAEGQGPGAAENAPRAKRSDSEMPF